MPTKLLTTNGEENMPNNHGMTPGYIARADEQAKAAFSWRWVSAIKALRELDPDFDLWFDSYPRTMTKGEFLPLMEERISKLEHAEVPA